MANKKALNWAEALRRPPPRAKSIGNQRLTHDSSMSSAEPTNEAQDLNSMPEDVLRAILARARFDDQAALKRVCKRFLAVITSRAFREERRASGCLEHTVLVMKYDRRPLLDDRAGAR